VRAARPTTEQSNTTLLLPRDRPAFCEMASVSPSLGLGRMLGVRLLPPLPQWFPVYYRIFDGKCHLDFGRGTFLPFLPFLSGGRPGIFAGVRVLNAVRPCAAPEPPLCKGRWHGEAVTEGLDRSTGCLQAIPQSAWRLTAPFTQGSLSGPSPYATDGRSYTRPSFYVYKEKHPWDILSNNRIDTSILALQAKRVLRAKSPPAPGILTSKCPGKKGKKGNKGV
jgi:hypothetical protein